MLSGKKVPRLWLLTKFFSVILFLFLLSKVAFVMAGEGGSVTDYAAVMWHGLPLDLATTSYLSALLWLVLLVSVWTNVPYFKAFYRIYVVFIATVLSVVLVSNICLYSFWGFPLDGTVFNYIDSPRGAAASVSAGYICGVVLSVLILAVMVFMPLNACFPKVLKDCKHRIFGTGTFVLVGGLLFLFIRGGVGKSTANVGMVYFSQQQFLNHAAVNPAFSIISSMLKTKDFSRQHDYFSEEERERVFSQMGYTTVSEGVDSLLNTSRPNVLIILMEGCGGTFVHAVDPEADSIITPNLNRLAREGVVFTQCYANSFRTDRGTICTLSGYPAFPDVSVMKLPAKAAALPSIASTLKKAGYATEFLYGGDINFTNTNGYLMSTGYERTYGDTSFSGEERRTHNWGVTDRIVFDRLYSMIKLYPTDRPWHTAMLTLASHEPWGVPYSRIKGDTIANAMAYLDDCIGRFICRFQNMPQWKNTLVVLIPDHGIGYKDLPVVNPRRSHIPLIWTGGAVKGPRVIEKICNQTDLAATLLGQLGLPHDDFRFSRDVTSRAYTKPSAMHVWPEGMYY